MTVAKSFFDLQLSFCRKVASLTRRPVEQVLFDYTNFYIRFGLGRDLDPAHADWQRYLKGVADEPDPGDWTFRFYLENPEATTAPTIEKSEGCFSYALLGNDEVKLHFQNSETEGHSPLAIERQELRRRDLARLFGHIRRTHPERTRVIGASWLYNLQAYRRLFPASYLETAQPAGARFQRMSLWGQFLDRHGETNEEMTRPFLERLDRQSSTNGLIDCFPFQVLQVQAPVAAFSQADGTEGRRAWAQPDRARSQR